jgi:hypothetical protein
MNQNCEYRELSEENYDVLMEDIRIVKPETREYNLLSIINVWETYYKCFIIRKSGQVILVIRITELEHFYSFDAIWLQFMSRADREKIMMEFENYFKSSCCTSQKTVWWWGC